MEEEKAEDHKQKQKQTRMVKKEEGEFPCAILRETATSYAWPMRGSECAMITRMSLPLPGKPGYFIRV